MDEQRLDRVLAKIDALNLKFESLEGRVAKLEFRQEILWRVMTGAIGTVLLAVLTAIVALVVRGSK